MEPVTSYQISVSSQYPHVAARIRAIVATSEHNESSLAEHEYDLYESGDEVLFISVDKYDQFQTVMEYEADNVPGAHINFLEALKRFPGTSVRVLKEKVI